MRNWADPPKLIDRMVFRADGEGYLPNTFSQLFIVSADGGAARQLTHGDFDHQGPPAFTADGAGVLISANRRADADYDPLDSEIYRIDLSDGSIHALTDRRGPDRHPVPSPDGKHIAYLGFDDKQLGYQATQLYVMDSDGSHSHSLTAVARPRRRLAEMARGRQDNRSSQYDDHGSTKIAAIDLQGKIRVACRGCGRQRCNSTLFGRFLLDLRQRPLRLHQGQRLRTRGARHRHVIARHRPAHGASSDTLLGQRTFGRARGNRFRFLGRSSAHARLDRQTPGLRSGEEIPLACLRFTADPSPCTRPSFAAEIQLYAAAGYVVLYMNPRGSTGLWRGVRQSDPSRLSGQGLR